MALPLPSPSSPEIRSGALGCSWLVLELLRSLRPPLPSWHPCLDGVTQTGSAGPVAGAPVPPVSLPGDREQIPRRRVRGCAWFCGDAKPCLVRSEGSGKRLPPGPGPAAAARGASFSKDEFSDCGRVEVQEYLPLPISLLFQHVSVSKPPSEGTHSLFDPENGFLMPARGV